MKVKTKVLFFCLFCFFAMLAYFVFSYESLKAELQLTPEWTCDISSTPEALNEEKPLPFRLGQYLGYFTEDGKIILNKNIPYKATLSQDFYALYSSNAENIQVFDPTGKERFIINDAGFPFIQEDRIFLMLPGGASFAVVNNADGRLDAVYEYTSPLTAFNSSQNGIVAGFADGNLLVFDKEGKEKFVLAPGGSKFPIIYGGAISASGNLYACVSGLEPQRFVLYKDEETYQKIIFHEFLKTNLKRQVYIHFSSDDGFVYFDSSNALSIVDVKKLEMKTIPINGIVLDIQELPVADTVYVLTRHGKNYTVTILEDHKQKSGEFSFTAESALILASGDSLYVGRDNKISKITVSKE